MILWRFRQNKELAALDQKHSSAALKVELLQLVEDRASEEQQSRLWQSIDLEVIGMVRRLLQLRARLEAKRSPSKSSDKKANNP